MKTKFTIITITYNDMSGLKKTIESVKSSISILNKLSTELVIVNGGDDQQVIEYLQSMILELSVKIIQEPDKGIADAFNKGVLASSGEYILFLNGGDSILNSDYFFKACQTLDKCSEYSFVCSDVIDDSNQGKILVKSTINKNIGSGMIYRHQSMICRKTLFDKYGNFDLSFKIAMDYEWVCRFWRIEKPFYLKLEDKAAILMDGHGVSVAQESNSINESKRALKKNDLFKNSVLFFYYYRVFKFLIRRLLKNIGLSRFIFFLRRLRS